MLHERIDRVRTASEDAVQLRFDLADGELFATARSLATIVGERYRGVELDADDVLELRELMALHDVALERAEDGYSGGTLILGVARLTILIDALAEWLERRLSLGFLRAHEALDLPVVETLIGGLRDLHARGVQAAHASGTPELATA